MFARCTRIAHLPLWSMDWDRSVIDLKVPDESLSTSRTSQLVWKIGSQNQSIRHSWVCCVLFCVSFTHGACLWMCFFSSFFFLAFCVYIKLQIHCVRDVARPWRWTLDGFPSIVHHSYAFSTFREGYRCGDLPNQTPKTSVKAAWRTLKWLGAFPTRVWVGKQKWCPTHTRVGKTPSHQEMVPPHSTLRGAPFVGRHISW